MESCCSSAQELYAFALKVNRGGDKSIFLCFCVFYQDTKTQKGVFEDLLVKGNINSDTIDHQTGTTDVLFIASFQRLPFSFIFRLWFQKSAACRRQTKSITLSVQTTFV